MGQNLNDTDRVALIRKGNALFNEGKIEEAKRYFLGAKYGDGLIRVGDHYFYDLKKPAEALLLYRQAGYTQKVQEICECIAAVIRTLLAEDLSTTLEAVLPPQEEWRSPEEAPEFVKFPGNTPQLPWALEANLGKYPKLNLEKIRQRLQQNSLAGEGVIGAGPEAPAPIAPAAADSFLARNKIKLAGSPKPKGSSGGDRA
jgi:hypothetical protein